MKKLYERAVVEAFLRWKGLPLSALEDSERERPDALIRVDERPVGVEVTTLTEANPRQRIAPQKWTIEAIRVVEAARIAFESSNPRPFVVRFQFQPDWQPPDRRTVPLFAAELAAVVETAGDEVSSDSETPLTLIDPHPAVSWPMLEARVLSWVATGRLPSDSRELSQAPTTSHQPSRGRNPNLPSTDERLPTFGFSSTAI